MVGIRADASPAVVVRVAANPVVGFPAVGSLACDPVGCWAVLSPADVAVVHQVVGFRGVRHRREDQFLDDQVDWADQVGLADLDDSVRLDDRADRD